MGITIKKGHSMVIAEASKAYDQSVQMFIEAEKKIDFANTKLDSTIEDINAAIAELEEHRTKALADKERNQKFKEKISEFTSI